MIHPHKYYRNSGFLKELPNYQAQRELQGRKPTVLAVWMMSK
jgi:hypothetical protein